MLSLLEEWANGAVDAQHVHEVAESLWDQHEWPILPDEDDRSIAIEVLMHLDMLNVQWITTDDIPAMRAFLGTLPGRSVLGWQAWTDYWDNLDFEKRRRDVQANDYYMP